MFVISTWNLTGRSKSELCSMCMYSTHIKVDYWCISCISKVQMSIYKTSLKLLRTTLVQVTGNLSKWNLDGGYFPSEIFFLYAFHVVYNVVHDNNNNNYYYLSILPRARTHGGMPVYPSRTGLCEVCENLTLCATLQDFIVLIKHQNLCNPLGHLHRYHDEY